MFRQLHAERGRNGETPVNLKHTERQGSTLLSASAVSLMSVTLRVTCSVDAPAACTCTTTWSGPASLSSRTRTPISTWRAHMPAHAALRRGPANTGYGLICLTAVLHRASACACQSFDTRCHAACTSASRIDMNLSCQFR